MARIIGFIMNRDVTSHPGTHTDVKFVHKSMKKSECSVLYML